MAAATVPAAEPCFHCGLEIPRGVDLLARVGGRDRPMCCVGCCAVAEMIEAQGLSDWYRTRLAPSGRPAEVVPDVLARSEFLELEELEADFETRDREGLVEVSLLVEGISCAACSWVIERHLGRLPGVRSVRVNLISHRARVRWEGDACELRDVIRALAEIGFTARPDRPDRAAALAREERRSALIRLGVAGLGTMNVMTYAVALYVGAVDGMEEGVRQFFRWMCLLVTTPVVVIAARPFFEGAARDLRIGLPGMDVPVSAAIAGGYLVSFWAVVQGAGEVYFESVCMFTFFLGAGRYLEMNVRHQASARVRGLLDQAPELARRIEETATGWVERVVAIGSLAPGDRLRVLPGDAMPVDGRVIEGVGQIEEALLTGEPWPKRVEVGSEVLAGSLNATSPLVVEATRVGRETTLAALVDLIERAQSEKPPIVRTADRVASVFVVCVLGIALATAIAWSLIAPERAIWVTLSVLVATCPCALGLATPAALAAATEALARSGFLVTRGHVLEGLARLDRVIFDKTGTLTRGEPRIESVIPLRGHAEAELIGIAADLEAGSGHVFAHAFEHAFQAAHEGHSGPGPVRERSHEAELSNTPGQGIEGKLGAMRHRIGRPEWALALAPRLPVPQEPPKASLSWVLLADEGGALAWFGISDSPREGALEAISRLRDQGLEPEMLSGDPSAGARSLARDLGLKRAASGVTPEGKVDHVQALQAQGRVVMVVGDGLNDGPVMGMADVSVAMGSGCDLARSSADAVLLNDDLTGISAAITCARRTRSVIRQNLTWAVAYNLCVLPLAVSGQLPPWLAAAGMSASSLAVAANAMRLRRIPEAS